MLQAHTEEEFQTWVSAIQSGVTKAYRDAEKRHSVTGVSVYVLEVFQKFVPGSIEQSVACLTTFPEV